MAACRSRLIVDGGVALPSISGREKFNPVSLDAADGLVTRIRPTTEKSGMLTCVSFRHHTMALRRQIVFMLTLGAIPCWGWRRR